jgi:hypothetical protein
LGDRARHLRCRHTVDWVMRVVGKVKAAAKALMAVVEVVVVAMVSR